MHIWSTVFNPVSSVLFNLTWITGLQVDEPTFAGLPINLYSVNRVNSCSVSELWARRFRLQRRRRHPPPDIASSFYLFLLWQEVDVLLDLDILFWGGNFASYLTFSIFPRPSSGLNCRSMFCNCVIRPPLRFIVTFLHRSLVCGVINASRLILPLWELCCFLRSVAAMTEFVMASVVICRLGASIAWRLHFALSGAIWNSCCDRYFPPLFFKGLSNTTLTSGFSRVRMYAAFLFSIVSGGALH